MSIDKIPPNDNKERGERYRATLGLALSNWQSVEHRLQLLFMHLVAVDPLLSSTIFESIGQVYSKLNTLDAVVRLHFRKDSRFLKREWTPLINHAHECRRKRNNIVHWFTMPWPLHGPIDERELIHVRSLFTELLASQHSESDSLVQKPKHRMTEPQIHDAAISFFRLQEWIDDFHRKVVQVSALPDKSSQLP